MLRIRGQLYLGRGITDTYSDVEDEDEEDQSENEVEDEDEHNTNQSSKSLLEKILTNSGSSSTNSNANVTILSDYNNRSQHLVNRLKLSPPTLLTPPPSISGISFELGNRNIFIN